MSVNYDYLINQIQRNHPTLPTIVNELTNVLQNPDPSTFAVEEVMTSDHPTTMKILRAVNTSFYRGGRDRVTDASEAVSTPGFEKIRNVILTTSLFKMFSGPSAEEKFSLTGLWRHSLGVASASRFIACYLGKSWHESAYTSGLVHDIGKVARYKLDEEDNAKHFINDSQLALDKKINFFKAELINRSPRHDYLGYLICKNWGLSSYVEGVVRWHHEPNPDLRKGVRYEEANELIDVVIFANWAVNHLKFGFSGHETPDTPSDALLRRLNLDASQVDQIQADIENELTLTEDLCELLDIGQESGGGTPKDRKSPIKFSKSLKHKQQRSWLDWFLNFKLSFFSKNKKENLRSDWVGTLSSVSDCNEEKVKTFEVSKDIESILVDEIRSVFGKGKRNIDLLDESIQVADLMSADRDANVPSLSEEQMNLLMGEVKKTFHEPMRVSAPKGKESKDESPQKADSTDSQNDWLGTLAAISNIEEIKTLKGVPKEREDTLLNELKTVFDKSQKQEDLFDESIQIAGMMDTGGDEKVPKLSEEQMNILLGELRDALRKPPPTDFP
jgi:HD-like signal output (HDOD) protein